MHIISGGGGGYGDPLERDAARVERDVQLGYVSVEAALADYGVVLDSSMRILPLETLRERDRRRLCQPLRASRRCHRAGESG